eukprot:scaffold26670_cov149-Skeletonema_menzelii.AAC.15
MKNAMSITYCTSPSTLCSIDHRHKATQPIAQTYIFSTTSNTADYIVEKPAYYLIFSLRRVLQF